MPTLRSRPTLAGRGVRAAVPACGLRTRSCAALDRSRWSGRRGVPAWPWPGHAGAESACATGDSFPASAAWVWAWPSRARAPAWASPTGPPPRPWASGSSRDAGSAARPRDAVRRRRGSRRDAGRLRVAGRDLPEAVLEAHGEVAGHDPRVRLGEEGFQIDVQRQRAMGVEGIGGCHREAFRSRTEPTAPPSSGSPPRAWSPAPSASP